MFHLQGGVDFNHISPLPPEEVGTQLARCPTSSAAVPLLLTFGSFPPRQAKTTLYYEVRLCCSSIALHFTGHSLLTRYISPLHMTQTQTQRIEPSFLPSFFPSFDGSASYRSTPHYLFNSAPRDLRHGVFIPFHSSLFSQSRVCDPFLYSAFFAPEDPSFTASPPYCCTLPLTRPGWC